MASSLSAITQIFLSFPSHTHVFLLSLLTPSFLAGLQQFVPSHHPAQELWSGQSQIIFAVMHLKKKVLQNYYFDL